MHSVCKIFQTSKTLRIQDIPQLVDPATTTKFGKNKVLQSNDIDIGHNDSFKTPKGRVITPWQ